MQLLEGFEHGDVELRVYLLSDGTKRWWIRSGAALLEFDEERLVQLLELLDAYVEETDEL